MVEPGRARREGARQSGQGKGILLVQESECRPCRACKERVQKRLDSLSPKSSAETRQSPDPLLLGNWQVTMGRYLGGAGRFLPTGVTVALPAPVSERPNLGTWKMDPRDRARSLDPGDVVHFPVPAKAEGYPGR